MICSRRRAGKKFARCCWGGRVESVDDVDLFLTSYDDAEKDKNLFVCISFIQIIMIIPLVLRRRIAAI